MNTIQEASEYPVTQLTISIEQLHYILDSITAPAFLHDEQFRILLANKAYYQVAHKTEADSSGQFYWQSFSLRDGPLPGCIAATTGTEMDSQEELTIDDKTYLSQGIVVRDTQGKFTYAFHVFTNVTTLRASEANLKATEAQLKASEANLKASDDKFQYFFDHSPIGKSITQLTGENRGKSSFLRHARLYQRRVNSQQMARYFAS